MNYFEISILISKIFTMFFALFLILAQIVVFKYPTLTKLNANFALTLTIILLFYLLSILNLCFLCIFIRDWFNCGILFLLLISPFVIGYFCTYNKLFFFANVQFFIVLAGLFYFLYL